MTKYPRYEFDGKATYYPPCPAQPRGLFSVTARTDRGWDITWQVEQTADGGWVISRSKPNNDTLYIKPTGSLGRQIMARVRATISSRPIGGV